ncbi:trans-sialidase [Trypanosoma cruzi]|nr:trans-sialidase [Trypanosoma cruzi]
MNRTTLAMAFLGLQKIAARPETRRARPLDKGRGGSVYPLPSRWQATGCFSTRVDAGEPFVRDCGLDSQNFTLEPDGAMVLDWPAAPKTARADPHRASRPARVREQDAPDTIKLCRALRHNEKLTNPRTAQVGRAVAP